MKSELSYRTSKFINKLSSKSSAKIKRVRALPCHGRGQELESPNPHQYGYENDCLGSLYFITV